MRRARAMTTLVGGVGGLMLLVFAGTAWGVPSLIRLAHAGRLPLADRLLAGRGSQPVETYLELWEPMGRGLAVVGWTTLLIGAGLVLLRRAARAPRRPAPQGDRAFLLVAAWLGLLAGLGEAWYYVTRVGFRGIETAGVTGISQHAVWMTPLANLVTFLLAGGIVLGVRRLTGGWPSARVMIASLAGAGLLAWVMVTGRVHWAAAVVLAAGVASQAHRLLSPGGGEAVGWARASFPGLLGLLGLLGLSVPAGEAWRARHQVAEAGHPVPGSPNVLLIVLDTERAASTSLHGHTRRTTPFLEELARRGVWFTRAIAPQSWTLPSHAAMFTGHRVDELGTDWNTPLDSRYPTLAEVLTQRGYATAGFVANIKYLSDVFGLDRGFGVWQDQAVTAGTVVAHSWLARRVVETGRRALGNYQLLQRKTADRVNAEFLSWLDQRPPRPFFAFLNYFDPHEPYLPPEPWNTAYSDSQPLYWVDPGRRVQDFTPTELDELSTAYDASIAYLDDRLRRLFDSLEARGLLESTLVIATSDHGEAFGEDGRLGHGLDLTLPMTHVPLVISWPGVVPQGRVIESPVGIRRIAATILAMTGGSDSTIPGPALDRHWEAPPELQLPDTAFSTDGWFGALVTERYQFLATPDGVERLFDHRADPRGLENLVDDPDHVDAVRALRAALHLRFPRLADASTTEVPEPEAFRP